MVVFMKNGRLQEEKITNGVAKSKYIVYNLLVQQRTIFDRKEKIFSGRFFCLYNLTQKEVI